MKKFLLIIFTICINSLFAQNYQNICTTGTTLYKPISTYLKAFRLDSIYLLGNNDTLFISYRTIRDTSFFDCRDTTNGSVLGRKVVKKHNGWFYFFNSNNDTIGLNTQAAINESWKFCDLPNNCHLQAQVTSIISDSVLGTIDQVKIITFQAKNINNVNISHMLNQKTIKLSQHYGLSKMLDVYLIPNDTINYILAGKTDPVIGLQDITWQQIYDFDIGDEFHYHSGVNYSYYYVCYGFEIYKVLDKMIYGNDSVTYIMERCSKDTLYSDSVTISSLHDTLTLTYNFLQLANDNTYWFTKLPEEFQPVYNYANLYLRYFDYNIRQTKSIHFNYSEYYAPYGQSACWQLPLTFYLNLTTNSYTEGLGTVVHDETFYWANSTDHSYKYLVYFKKGSEIWGTPVALDCWTLTGIEQSKEKRNGIIHIVPNPVETESKIWFETNGKSEELHFLITDYLGRNVTQFSTDKLPYTFNRTGLPHGLYILLVYDKTGFLRGRAKLIIL